MRHTCPQCMLRHTLYLVFCVALLSLAALPALAQETAGSIEGTITDASGARVPGVVVKIEGSAFVRTATTNSEGFYRMLQVPPGTYKVSASASAFSPAVAEGVSVLLGKATPLDFTLKVGAVQEQVVITGEDAARIDPTDNKVQSNITARTIESLPKGTNFTSALKLAPSTRGEGLAGGFQVDGASGSENSFIIDGQEVNHFRTGTLPTNNNLPFAFVQEVQVKSSGFEAEFGGATGGVINVVTKSGGNEFHGRFGAEWEPLALQAGPRSFLSTFRTGTGANFVQINQYLRNAKDDSYSYFPTGMLSGPVVKDRLWFLASYSPQLFSTKRTSNYYTTDPRNRTLTATERYRVRDTNEYAFGRLDASLLSNLRVSGTYTWNPIVRDGAIPASNVQIGGSPPTANFGGGIGTLRGAQLTNLQGGRQNSNNVTAQAVWTPTGKLVSSFRFSRGFLNERLGSYFIPAQTRYACTGLNFPADAGCVQGFANISSNSGNNRDVSTRTAYEGDVSYLINHFVGRHEFKGGYQHSTITNDVDRGYIALGQITLTYGQPITNAVSVPLPPNPDAIGYGLLRRIGTIGNASNRAQSFYLQDKWQPITRLTLNVGARFEKEDLPSFNGFAPPINFGWGDKIAPRLGFAYDLTGNGKTKVFASFGRFNDRLKFELPRGSFGGDFWHDDYFYITRQNPRYDYYTPERIRGSYQDIPGGQCPIPNSPGLTICNLDFRIASNDPSGSILTGKVDPNLVPFRQTEFTAGVERELGWNFLLSARYTHKNVDNAVEDAGFPNAQGSEAYVIGNPGSGLHLETAKQYGYSKVAKPERRYDGLEIVLDRRFSRSYQLTAAYTYSRLFGNYSGLASSDESGRTSPGVNRFFDLPFIGFTAEGKPDNGRLATDRPHVFRAYGSYAFDWLKKLKNNSTVFGFFTIAQSGTQLTSFFTYYTAASILFGRGDMGRTPVFTQTDLSVAHHFKFGDNEQREIVFDFNVINAFNQATITGKSTGYVGTGATNANNLGLRNASGQVLDEVAAINYLLNNGILDRVQAYVNDPARPELRNSARGLPTGFQGARSVRLGVRFTF